MTKPVEEKEVGFMAKPLSNPPVRDNDPQLQERQQQIKVAAAKTMVGTARKWRGSGAAHAFHVLDFVHPNGVTVQYRGSVSTFYLAIDDLLVATEACSEEEIQKTHAQLCEHCVYNRELRDDCADLAMENMELRKEIEALRARQTSVQVDPVVGGPDDFGGSDY